MDNTVASVNLMEFARKYHPDLDRFVYLSTAEVFGPAPQGVTHKEYDRYNSGNPYAAAKVGLEFSLQRNGSSSGINDSKLTKLLRLLLKSLLLLMRTLTRCQLSLSTP